MWAVDAAPAMVAETRRRLSEVLGAEAAEHRVVHGEMRALPALARTAASASRGQDDGAFDLVVALGVLQDAQSTAEWAESLAEVARVLRPGGLCLVANFGPDSRPDGQPLTRTADGEDTWVGWGPGPSGRRMILPDLAGLDAAFGRTGLTPAVPTQRVQAATALGYRVTYNALYRKAG